MPEAENSTLSNLVETEEYPPSTLPQIYSEGVTGFIPGPEVIKFYLYRLLPKVHGRQKHTLRPAAEVAMALSVFVKTVVFFDRTLEILISRGYLTQEQIDSARKADREFANANRE